ncbi:Rhodanese-related sulfurtransferase [Modestobacter sp. DSM 44400]|uniref:rhodanese-like domain-containing protein n=1 Tax=Modestobacter sp. DSM 44400 TaxID=1550230 RepID=UPI00089AE7B5|nr:rhodanese-like domain-containing protein [Modestobacter sp. DSM 44400]SDY80143.1 Rhodanese-related sulfurtransferase [Modestobacter sp. DSM 44400]
MNRFPDRIDASTLLGWAGDPDAVTVIDVRNPAEFETAHIPGSYNVPLSLLGEHAAALAARLDRQVVLVCQSGARAADAQRRLAGVGAEKLHVLDGGIGAYAAAGGEVVRGRARWGMERQVRFVAGSLVVLGVALGLRFRPAGLLAGGIGAGLTVSALTDTCTMARVLSALPYNRGPRDRTADEVLSELPGLRSAA